jgi:hypothetical protein
MAMVQEKLGPSYNRTLIKVFGFSEQSGVENI